MKPFLRRADRGQIAPVGWVAQPAGEWGGRAVDVVYDPRRHDVLLVRNDPGDSNRRHFAEVGYERVKVDGVNEMWVRDRTGPLTARLQQLADRPRERTTADGVGRSR